MGIAAEKVERFTYGHYRQWPEDERWELIDGVPFDMTPAPSPRHQEILGELHRQISNYLLDKTCKVYVAPFDVRLPAAAQKEDDTDTVLQPDISVICDLDKVDDRGCLGSPDWVVEIVSPATAQRDMKEKFLAYERFGVKEYWIIHPMEQILMVFKRQPGGRYGRPDVYSPGDKVEPGVLPGFSIDLSTVF
jgi:Uma2 family endonuclease